MSGTNDTTDEMFYVDTLIDCLRKADDPGEFDDIYEGLGAVGSRLLANGREGLYYRALIARDEVRLSRTTDEGERAAIERELEILRDESTSSSPIVGG